MKHEVYAASWEKLLGTMPPPQMTEQEADEALERMGKDFLKKRKSYKHMLECFMDVEDTHRIRKWKSWQSKEELIQWCWLC